MANQALLEALLLTGQNSANWGDINWAGKLVDLSSFQNVIFGHDLKSTLGLGYHLGHVNALHKDSAHFELFNTVVRIEVGRDSKPKEISYSFELPNGTPVILWFHYDPENMWTLDRLKTKNPVKLANELIQYLAPKGKNKVAQSFDHTPRQWSSSWRAANYALEEAGFMSEIDSVGLSRLFNDIEMPIDVLSRLNADSPQFKNKFQFIALSRLLKAIMAELNARFSSIRHVGPSRVVSSNIQSAGKSGSQYLMSDGSNLLQTLDAEKVSRLNVWLGTVTEGQYSAKIKRIPNALLGELRTLILRDNHTRSDVQLKDVGSGLSQIIPVLQNLVLGSAPLVLLQQPELHLHPKMQSHLADLLAQEASSKPSSRRGRRSTIVVETHSENLILRVQKLIRTGALDPGDVSVLYVDRVRGDSQTPQRSKKSNHVQTMELDSRGEFKSEWPVSFSDLRLDEIF